jgi:hypothetical protein
MTASQTTPGDLASQTLTGQFKDIDLARTIRFGYAARSAQFTNCNFAAARLTMTTFTNVVFTDCDFTDTVFAGAEISGVDFVRCALARTRFIGANLQDITTQDCDFSHIAIYQSWIDHSFSLPRGYARANPARGDRADRARPILDAELFRKTAHVLGVAEGIAMTLIKEHPDTPPLDLLGMLSTLKAPGASVFPLSPSSHS